MRLSRTIAVAAVTATLAYTVATGLRPNDPQTTTRPAQSSSQLEKQYSEQRRRQNEQLRRDSRLSMEAAERERLRASERRAAERALGRFLRRP